MSADTTKTATATSQTPTRGKVKGNIAMGVAKTFSGLNENALKYLVPNWMSPFTGVVLRLGFGAIAFWIISWFTRSHAVKTTPRQRWQMMLWGAITMFGFMSTLLLGLKYTTPITSSIFISLQPAVVFIIALCCHRERATTTKILGIVAGIAGALVIVLTQKTSAHASNPLLGAALCMISTIFFASFLVISSRYLAKIDKVTVSKYFFSGGALASIIAILFIGWDAPVLSQPLLSTPWLVLLFVLIFPTVISYFLTDIGLKYLKTTVVALYANVILIVAAIVSYILRQDIFSWWQIIAMALIIASVYLVEKAEKKE